MPQLSYRRQLTRSFLISALLRDITSPPPDDPEEAAAQYDLDLTTLIGIQQARYLRGRAPVLKVGNMHLAWEYAQSPMNHRRFIDMLRVSPEVFQFLLGLIDEHPVFHNNSNHAQASVEDQLAVTLYRLGRYGNGASLEDVARVAGCSVGSVENFTQRCFDAIFALHDQFIRPLTAEEKEREKEWIDQHLGYRCSWRNGWVMYDGTIVVLYAKPGMHGDAYYTRKGNYGMNLQVGNVPSNLRIVDYSVGHTGSAHDATAFEFTAAAKRPDTFFGPDEFAWADSAYTVNSRTIPVHRRPASLEAWNIIFDTMVSRLRVRSEHCMGALKGRFQSLRGLRIAINENSDHEAVCRWIIVTIILHNIIIDIEGDSSAAQYIAAHGRVEEEIDGRVDYGPLVDRADDEARRCLLVEEIVAIRSMA